MDGTELLQEFVEKTKEVPEGDERVQAAIDRAFNRLLIRGFLLGFAASTAGYIVCMAIIKLIG